MSAVVFGVVSTVMDTILANNGRTVKVIQQLLYLPKGAGRCCCTIVHLFAYTLCIWGVRGEEGCEEDIVAFMEHNIGCPLEGGTELEE